MSRAKLDSFTPLGRGSNLSPTYQVLGSGWTVNLLAQKNLVKFGSV